MSVDLDVVLHLQPPEAVWLMAVCQSLSQGIIALQYWSHRRQAKVSGDSRPLTAFVLSMIVLTVLQSALEWYKSWRVLVRNVSWLQDPLRWAELILNGILCNAIQAFFIRRCWQATRSRILLIALVATLLLVLSADIWLTICVLSDVARASFYRAMHDVGALNRTTGGHCSDHCSQRPFAHRYTKTVNVMFGIYMGGSAVLDSAITAVLMLFLYQSRTGLEKLDAVVYKILNVTWEVQALPMLFAIVACCLFFTWAHLDYVIFFSVMTGKLYMHGLLRTLNMRAQLRRRIIQEEMVMHNLQPWLLRDKTATQSPQTSQFAPEAGSSSRQLPHLSRDAVTELSESAQTSTGFANLTERTGHSTLTPDGTTHV
ncbi:hypothetical protein EXIGLDRAFT_743637 [Exidia glandulosa HHB12029]|uniref:DUF6534 domain-containing protein n=1 Tax=Exidia glandulosa HHB12029 TaxID=1314781 RepID=A0A165QSC4_EXIGL|nr:hypothetical protein EXIGLDRAFT_743637 [Exidia glandulosa HHB12029]